jgi:hypothetical protein
MPILFIRICVKSRRPTPPISTPASPWSVLDLQDLRYCLAAGWPAEDIADFLCRSVDEVRTKTAEIARDRS